MAAAGEMIRDVDPEPGSADSTDADVAAILGVPVGRLASKRPRRRAPGWVYLITGLVIGLAVGPLLTEAAKSLSAHAVTSSSPQPLRGAVSSPTLRTTAATTAPAAVLAEGSPPPTRDSISLAPAALPPESSSETIARASVAPSPRAITVRAAAPRRAETHARARAAFRPRGVQAETPDRAARIEAQDALALLH